MTGRSGTMRDTYFSPNSVLGTIAAVTLAGIVSQLTGEDAERTVAPWAVASKPSTSPTMTPRIFTSARSGICSPMVDASRVTSSKWVNFLLKTP